MYPRSSSLICELHLDGRVGGNEGAWGNLMSGRMQVTALLVLPGDDDFSLSTQAYVEMEQ
jgi:hypothetical protein